MLAFGIVTLVLVALAFGLMTRSATIPRARRVARMEELGAYGFAGTASLTGVIPADTVRRRPIPAIAIRLGGLAKRQLGPTREEAMRKELVKAGMYRTSPVELVGYRIMAALFAGLLVVVARPAASDPLNLLLGIVAGVGGWILPIIYVHRRARMRIKEIDRSLPDLIDQIVVTIEAGLGFSSSMQVAADKFRGPLGDEMRLTLQEQRMGQSINDALKSMGERAPAANMLSFVRAVVQGENLGVSIGTIMRNLAHEMRLKRRQAAEEQAQKAPVKMLFPMVFLMFPAMGVVILGPAIFEIFETLGGLTK